MQITAGFLLCCLSVCILVVSGKCESSQDALLKIFSNTGVHLKISYRSSECVACSIRPLVKVYKANVTARLDTFYPSYAMFIQDEESGKNYCTELETDFYKFGENGTYLLAVKDEVVGNSTVVMCSISVLEQAESIYVPIWCWTGSLIIAALVYVFLKNVYKKHYLSSYATESNLNNDLGIPQVSSSTYLIEEEKQQAEKSAKTKKTARMKSVDVLRGFCLCIMIFVNYGAGGYSFLDHAPWNGLHLADTVFPGFVFIMGVSLPMSFKSLSNKPEMKDPTDGSFRIFKLVYKITKRCVLLFFFGLLTSNSSGIYLSDLRIMGVLQRFSATYFICALIELIYFRIHSYAYFDQNSLEINWQTSKYHVIRSYFKEIFYYPIQWLIVLMTGLIWVLLTYLLPVEGCPTGYTGPGGLHMNSKYFNCTAGSAGLIDRLILGYNHVYQQPTSKSVYLNQLPHDPEGLLGCLTSIILCYLGVSCGHIIIHYQQPKKRIIRFLVYALVYILSALILCEFSIDDGWMPINKNLWSLSFVLIMAGMAFFVLTVFYVLVDLVGVYSGTPFLYLGRNSITIYICHIVFQNYFPFFLVDNRHWYLLSSDLYGVAIWCTVAAIMNHYKVFINL